MSDYCEFEGGILRVTDPVYGETVTSHEVPRYIEESVYAEGLNYLRANAQRLCITLYFIQHDTADNLGPNFEQRLAESDTLAIEDNGWTDEFLVEYRKLSGGDSISEFTSELEREYGSGVTLLCHDAQDESTYYGRLLQAIEGSGKQICIADRKKPEWGEFGEELDRLWNRLQRHYSPQLGQVFHAHREWLMLANLGMQLASAGPNAASINRILFPVGATHFLLFDKLIALGIVADQEAISGDAGTIGESDHTGLQRPLANIGMMPIEEIEWDSQVY